MKKMIVFLLLFLSFGAVFAGCRSSLPETEDPLFCKIEDIEWTRNSGNCTETICFRENGNCSYYCACGNPVNDDDLCQGYRYDPESRTIYLHFSETTDETVTKIIVKSCDGETLTLDFCGELRTFQRVAEKEEQVDKLSYGGEKYVYLTFPGDIFYYDLRESVDCEEDEVVPIPHNKWKLAYREGDLFVLESHKDAAVNYYSKDENYNWFAMIDDPETEEPFAVSLSVTAEELAYIYSMEGMKRETTLFFDDIEIFGSLVKTDKEGVISASTSLAYYKGAWYWRSEIIDEGVEGWPEYVVKIPDGISKQITAQCNP